MPDTEKIVINTGPLIALVAALEDLSVLQSLYNQVLVPFEVCQEMLAGGRSGFGVKQFEEASWLQKWPDPLDIAPILINSLDQGEAAVIQLALNQKVETVCIDEAVGRRMARLSGLSLTGSVGILLRARREGYSFSMQNAIQRMTDKGIWLSQRVVNFALNQANEGNK
jgi:predicted nucleic acid-binding protein